MLLFAGGRSAWTECRRAKLETAILPGPSLGKGPEGTFPWTPLDLPRMDLSCTTWIAKRACQQSACESPTSNMPCLVRFVDVLFDLLSHLSKRQQLFGITTCCGIEVGEQVEYFSASSHRWMPAIAARQVESFVNALRAPYFNQECTSFSSIFFYSFSWWPFHLHAKVERLHPEAKTLSMYAIA